jgi:hypothetical protein
MGSTCGIVELVSAAELPAGMQVKDSGASGDCSTTEG